MKCLACHRPATIRKHRLCLAHYKRYQRTGRVDATPIRPRRNLPKAKVKS